ncbi:MAG: Crp/Fnr family transcriptional regulator [Rhizobiaceae bacterium]|nr:MAG: Crp/Fnr family transcriptional regulator [Rhizobiaceae bacterium]
MKNLGNRFLSLVGQDALTAIAGSFETVRLRQGQSIHEPMQRIDHIYFFTKGLSSEIAIDDGGQRIEVGCIGFEGFAGVPAVLGVDRSPHRSFMETDGTALRIETARLMEAARADHSLMSPLLRYVHVFMMQVAATALADGRYNVEQRTARWLLMAHDRLESDELPLTHDFLALMLGVRRSSVTNALHVVEGSGAIKASRSLITVRDRDKLERLAGASYGLPEAEYQRVLG